MDYLSHLFLFVLGLAIGFYLNLRQVNLGRWFQHDNHDLGPALVAQYPEALTVPIGGSVTLAPLGADQFLSVLVNQPEEANNFSAILVGGCTVVTVLHNGPPQKLKVLILRDQQEVVLELALVVAEGP